VVNYSFERVLTRSEGVVRDGARNYYEYEPPPLSLSLSLHIPLSLGDLVTLMEWLKWVTPKEVVKVVSYKEKIFWGWSTISKVRLE
jgi:hypothetical protein